MLAISVDSQFSHLAWMNTERAKGGVAGIQIPLVSDITKEVSKAYEVLVTDNADELWGASLRGLYIIDGKGMSRKSHRHNPIYNHQRCSSGTKCG